MPEDQPQKPTASPPPVPGHTAPAHPRGHLELPAPKFWQELKRRNVGRVAILYIVVSYVALQVFELFFHLLDLPSWVGRVVVLAVVVGFPVVVIFAWVYEVTPEGLKPTAEVAPQHSIRHHTGKRLDRAIIALLAIALAYFVLDKFWLSKHVSTAAGTVSNERIPTTAAVTVSDKSIAVLPFVDMSEKHDQEYLGDGMAEEILDLLAKIPGLTVIGRTSSFSFKGKNEDLRTIGSKLNAAYLLEGSVRKSSDQVRITAQLINTRTGTHEWSETYDRPIGDVLKLQDAIAATVVRELQITVAPEILQPRATNKNADVYDLILRGRHASDRANREGQDDALTLYRQALDRDPTSAEVEAELGQVYAYQVQVGSMAPAQKRQSHNADVRDASLVEHRPSALDAAIPGDQLCIVGGSKLPHYQRWVRGAPLEIEPLPLYGRVDQHDVAWRHQRVTAATRRPFSASTAAPAVMSRIRWPP